MTSTSCTATTRVDVVAFTSTQIPFIADRRYPAELTSSRYPDGIGIHDESELSELIHKLDVDDVAFSYSDASHEYVMHKASEVLAAGANFARTWRHRGSPSSASVLRPVRIGRRPTH